MPNERESGTPRTARLRAILCDPEGTPCFTGSDGDRREAQLALLDLERCERDLATAQAELARLRPMAEYLSQLVELKIIKRKIEAGTATPEQHRYYTSRKEYAWMEAEQVINDYRAIDAARAMKEQEKGNG